MASTGMAWHGWLGDLGRAQDAGPDQIHNFSSYPRKFCHAQNQATDAASFLVMGERDKISFSAPQAGTALAARPPDEHPQRWLRTAAAIIIGVATIVGVLIALMEPQAGVSNAR